MRRALFAALLLASLAAFAWTLRRFGKLVMAGRAAGLPPRTGDRIGSVLTFFLGQKKVAEMAVIPAARAQRLGEGGAEPAGCSGDDCDRHVSPRCLEQVR